MSTELIINASLPETRIALMENGEIQDLLIERASGKGITGNIYKGRVTRVLPGMQAAFVDIGLEKAAFLYVDDVYVHSEIFEEEEESAVAESAKVLAEVTGAENAEAGDVTEGSDVAEGDLGENEDSEEEESSPEESGFSEEHEEESDSEDDSDEDSDDSDDSNEPVEMSAGPGDGDDDDSAGNRSDAPAQQHPGTLGPSEGQYSESSHSAEGGSSAGSEGGEAQAGSGSAGAPGEGDRGGRRRHRRGRRGGRFRNRRDRERGGERQGTSPTGEAGAGGEYPETFQQHVSDAGQSSSDRADLSGEASPEPMSAETGERRPTVDRQAFRSQRSKDRRIPARGRSRRPIRAQVNIQDLLKEGQEVIVQVAKDPIATKGARLTCHISLPGRHLVCMPTIDHVGVSRRIERDDERRRLRDIVERNRPRNLGFIVRTASGRGQAEARIRQDIDYLTHLWGEIKEKAAEVTAPALVYEDLNSVLRSIRDWVTEDIDKIIVDSRYHYNDIQRFVSHFMPSLKSKVELYHGDIPIFDAYKISTELSRALERKVWLKSGGYLVIDQAEALVAIDVNTGRYVGKKNLEDTILKTNLEAVQEIAYQLRLRNCGGIIILDLIDMEKDENKQRVYRALEEALKRDRARPTIIKISELGLVEMTRKRTRDTIVRSLCESCSHCEGKGFIKSKVTVAYEVLREIEREVIERDVSKILVQANPDVIDILAIDERETLDQIERRYRKQIYLQAVTDFHQEQFEVSGDKKPGKQAGEFSEVVQPLRGASADRAERGDRGHDRGHGHDRGGERDRGDRDRGRRGRRDRGRGRDRGQDRGRDRDREQGAPIQAGGQGMIQPVSQGPIQAEDSYAASETGQTPAPELTENMGNTYGPGTSQESAEPREMDESFGNSAQPQGDSQAAQAGQGQGGSGGQGSEDDDDFFENEEDRLAFLRAQAAQDAALARLSNGGGPGHHGRGGGMGGGRGHGNGSGGGGGGGRNERGGRRRRGRGGSGRNDKFRGGGRDHRGFSGRGGHGGGFGGGGTQGGGISGGGQGGGQGGGGNPGGGGSPAGGSEGGSTPSGGDFGGGGGGGDRSTPPVV